MPSNREDGFTLVELMMVLAVVAIRIAVVIPNLAAFRSRANDARAKADLAHAGTAELGVAVTDGAFTADTARLDAMVPGLAFGVVPGGITVVVGDVEAGDGLRVLLYARSKSGVWFGLHLVDAESARDTCTGGAEADMTLAGCVGSEW